MKSRKGITTTGVLTIVTIGLIGYGLYAYVNINSMLSDIKLELNNVMVSGYSIFPPSIDLELIYRVHNPTTLECEMSLNLDTYLGSTYLTSFNSNANNLPPNSYSPISVDVSLSGDIIVGLISNIDKFYNANEYTTTGQITITHKMLGIIPITITKTIN